MLRINPYRPGAGLQPVYLAGRQEYIDEITASFDAMNAGIPVQSYIFSGLRGVGKTVLLNKIESMGTEHHVSCYHIEVEERKDFISQISTCASSYLRETKTVETFLTDLKEKVLGAIKSLVVSFDPTDNTYSLSMQEREYYKIGNLSQGMTNMFELLGQLAKSSNHPICFFVDEIQYMKQEELGSLIASIHRVNQLGYPIMVVGAGLPKIYKMLSEVKSYSERLFVYREIDSLDHSAAIDAIVKPGIASHITYTENAVERIIEVTEGYPYYIQQFCYNIVKRASSASVTKEDVDMTIENYYHEMDNGFFKVRYERCSETDKKFIFAMVDCGKLPCTIANVAANMGKNVTSISTTRAQLINKGIIYAVRYKELDFTVPQFAEYIRRHADYIEFHKETKSKN